MDSGRRRRLPQKVPRRTTPSVGVQDKTIHEKRQEEMEDPARFVSMPRRQLPRGQMGEGGAPVEPSAKNMSGSAVTRLLTVAKDNQERTGFEVLQHSYDKDSYPTTLAEAGKTDSRIRIASFADVTHTEEGQDDPSPRPARRYCEIIEGDGGIHLVHKLRQTASDEGCKVEMAHSTASINLDRLEVGVTRGPHTVTMVLEDQATCHAWYQMLLEAAALDEANKAFESRLDETYGVGLDFLAEVEREERGRIRNNRDMFGDGTAETIQEDELFLIQLPHILPSVAASARRSASAPAPAPGAAPTPGSATPAPPGSTAAQRSTSQPHAPGERQGELKQKPGSGWTGRALGSEHHKSSLESLPPGRIGRIQIHRSGRIKMHVGECVFDVSSGGEAAYSQILTAVYSAEARYKANGWGPQGCPVFSKPTLAAQTGLRKSDGEVITVGQELQTDDGYFYRTSDGWVLREGGVDGKWVDVSTGDAAARPRAYELGHISRKIIVTPDFDKFEAQTQAV
eukprot:TRINITY_DN66583_c0_g1_i1.p1 TRINITY_DN66583_c0_g1~~TRINITY_DN66583_c0_g1_i1.p1  ORF type:complete len:530 (+),score=169.86 TRINITY_DN66583_c0_g1_i1:59-1591(+)